MPLPPPFKRPGPPPPRKRSGPPPKRLPSTPRVKVALDPYPDYGYTIVTTLTGGIVGPRLDRGRGNYPDVQTYEIPTLVEAIKSMNVWDLFIQEQDKERKKKK